MIKDYLKENQPLFYRIIENEFNLKKIPHAFLLVGNNTDQPLQFLTMSLICNETLACEQCIDCKKVLNHQYADIIEIDGEEESIKKKHIENIQETFKKSSLEGKAKVYILKNVEKTTKEAMNALLKILEGNIMNVNIIDGKLASVIPFDTSKLTVIGLGAFAGIIKQEKKIALGFNSVSSNDKEDVDYSKITSKDFVDYGMLPELMGRFTSRVYMHTLKKEDLRNILLFSNESPLILYKEYFKNLNIEFSYDDDFIDEVADGAYNLDLGARGLKVVLDDIISPYLFEVYAGNIKKIHLKSSNDYKLKHKLEENL